MPGKRHRYLGSRCMHGGQNAGGWVSADSSGSVRRGRGRGAACSAACRACGRGMQGRAPQGIQTVWRLPLSGPEGRGHDQECFYHRRSDAGPRSTAASVPHRSQGGMGAANQAAGDQYSRPALARGCCQNPLPLPPRTCGQAGGERCTRRQLADNHVGGGAVVSHRRLAEPRQQVRQQHAAGNRGDVTGRRRSHTGLRGEQGRAGQVRAGCHGRAMLDSCLPAATARVGRLLRHAEPLAAAGLYPRSLPSRLRASDTSRAHPGPESWPSHVSSGSSTPLSLASSSHTRTA